MLNIFEFGADWCSGCRTLRPIVEEAVKDYDDIYLKQINVDEDDDNLCGKYKVMSLPTIVFEDISIGFVRKIVGTVPKETIKDVINTYKELKHGELPRSVEESISL